MYDFLSSLWSGLGSLVFVIAMGFELACGFWLWSQFIESINWLITRRKNKKSN